jgi:hypothetical protein
MNEAKNRALEEYIASIIGADIESLTEADDFRALDRIEQRQELQEQIQRKGYLD